MTLDEAIERYTSNAEYERAHGNLQGCLDFKKLAEWLKDYKRYRKVRIRDDEIQIKNRSTDSYGTDAQGRDQERQAVLL